MYIIVNENSSTAGASKILNLHVNAALACNISIVYKQADLQM